VEPLLFLSHRLPYPPTKGDKVRSCHFLRHLASRYRVYLGTFMDDAADWPHLDAVRRICSGLYVEPLVPWMRRATSSAALFSGEPITLPYFRSRALQRWVLQTVREAGISRAFIFSSAMAQYVLDLRDLHTVVDFVDMDSQKWADYAARRSWPASTIFRREARRLLRYELGVAARAQASLFVTHAETRRFLAHKSGKWARVLTVPNGVDSDFFSPIADLPSPFAAAERPLVFTGSMDYWPNVDAVVWFAREVLPILRQRDAALRFYVVGMNPDLAVRALADDPSVVVTGRVPDVRPYLQHAAAVVAPLRVARGVQNKVLEAMAMGKAVITTPACLAGIAASQGAELEVAADAQSFAAKVEACLDPAKAQTMGRLARERVLRDYTWRASYRLLDELFAPAAGAAAKAMAL
jgi:sugar transferase (PEP-CTERM/EpsH1 system associated)